MPRQVKTQPVRSTEKDNTHAKNEIKGKTAQNKKTPTVEEDEDISPQDNVDIEDTSEPESRELAPPKKSAPKKVAQKAKSKNQRKNVDEDEDIVIDVDEENEEDKPAKKETKSKKIKKEDNVDSSEMPDIDDNQSVCDAFQYDEKKQEEGEDGEENDEDAEEYANTVVLERVIKYIKLDDVIRDKQTEHRKEMKAIKDAKDQLETFLIGYLDKVNEEYIQLGKKTTLMKKETQTKAAPKMEDISVCLLEGFKKHEIYENDDEAKRVVKDFLKTIEEKREVKTRKSLRRMEGDDKKKGDKENAKNVKKSAAEIAEDLVNNAGKDKGSEKGKEKSKKSVSKKADE
jgi:hypothetical protein